MQPKKAIAVQILGLAVWKANEKALKAKMAKEERKTGLADFNCAGVAKAKLQSVVQASFGDVLLGIASDDKQHPWLPSVTGFQAVVTEPNYLSTGAAPWCTSQCLLTLSGSEVVAGCFNEDLPGATFAEKVKGVMESSLEDLQNKFSLGSGFLVKLKPGELLMVPAGFFLLQLCGAEGTCSLRWGRAPVSPSERRLVQTTLEGIMQSFPVLRTSAHTKWIDFLGQPLKIEQ